MSEALLRKAFAVVPALRPFRPSDFVITPLAGLTNHNFRLCHPRHDWVLRIPKAETSPYIDRAAEAHNQVLACDLGIAVCASWRDLGGLSLTATLVDSRAAVAADFADRERLHEILDPIRLLHRSGARFAGRVQLDQLLQRYQALLPDSGQASFAPRLQAANRLLPLLTDRDCDYVPSHNDLVLDNLLIAPRRAWLIDWEFSAMASPYWDLATLCNAANLDYDASLQLLHLYCDDGPVMEASLLFDYRNLLQLLSDCWMAALFID